MIGFFPQPEPWMLDAACARVSMELCFPDKGDSRGAREAKKVCEGCISREPCLEFALEHGERWGVWGGKSERERRAMRKVASAEVAA